MRCKNFICQRWFFCGGRRYASRYPTNFRRRQIHWFVHSLAKCNKIIEMVAKEQNQMMLLFIQNTVSGWMAGNHVVSVLLAMIGASYGWRDQHQSKDFWSIRPISPAIMCRKFQYKQPHCRLLVCTSWFINIFSGELIFRQKSPNCHFSWWNGTMSQTVCNWACTIQSWVR